MKHRSSGSISMIFGLDKMKSFVETTVTIIPSFHDVDPMGVVWHGNYLRFFERAREELFRRFDYGYRKMQETGFIWPVVDVEVKYRAPWMVEEPAEVTAGIVEYENRLVIQYEIRNTETGKLMTKGRTVHMAFDLKTKKGLLVCPDILFEKFHLSKPC